MLIHQSKALSNGHTLVLAESAAAGGGRRYGDFRALRVVALPPGMATGDYRTATQRGVEQFFSQEADGRNRGPRSGFNKAMLLALAKFDAFGA